MPTEGEAINTALRQLFTALQRIGKEDYDGSVGHRLILEVRQYNYLNRQSNTSLAIYYTGRPAGGTGEKQSIIAVSSVSVFRLTLRTLFIEIQPKDVFICPFYIPFASYETEELSHSTNEEPIGNEVVHLLFWK